MELNGSGHFGPTRFFQDPQTMSDDELEQEYRASQRPDIFNLVSSPYVSLEVKDELKRHSFEVEQEYRARKNEEWIYPLSEFFF